MSSTNDFLVGNTNELFNGLVMGLMHEDNNNYTNDKENTAVDKPSEEIFFLNGDDSDEKNNCIIIDGENKNTNIAELFSIIDEDHAPDNLTPIIEEKQDDIINLDNININSNADNKSEIYPINLYETEEDITQSEVQKKHLSPDELSKEIDEDVKRLDEEMTDDEFNRLIDDLFNQNNAPKIKTKEEIQREEWQSRVVPIDYVNCFDEEVKDLPMIENPSDALIICLEELGRVDIEYISARTGLTPREVIADLEGKNAIYQNPKTCDKKFYKGWETADEYLSGNLMIKYKEAEEASKTYPDSFTRNLEALKAASPEKLVSDDIYATIGSPWIPARYYNDFLVYYLKVRRIAKGVTYNTILKRWEVNYSVRNLSSRYDILGMTALEIFEHTLNNTPIKVYDKKVVMGKEIFIPNKSRTLAGIERQKGMIVAFRDWIFSDPRRKEALENIYFEKYGCVTARKFDGSFLKLDGINPAVTLYPHQRSAIARIILTSSCLLSHSVGAGKTFVMIAGGMEMRRIGISKRNMYVVPNAIIEQWKNDFNYLYPASHVLIVDHRNMSPKKRDDTLKLIRDSDFDAIVISYNSFKMIPISPLYKKTVLEKRFREITDLTGRKYGKELLSLSEQILELENIIKEEKANPHKQIYFDDLKITSLFVDEAHNFKNINIISEEEHMALTRTRSSSQQATDMLLKIGLLRLKNAKSIVFATGTPITNSLSDLFIMQTYLQPSELKFYNIENFDQWALMFGEKTENFEMDVDSTNFRIVERFNKFHNLTELANIFASVADFHVEDDESLFSGINRKTIEVPLSKEQRAYLKELTDRTEAIRNRTQRIKQDNNSNKKGDKVFRDNLLNVTQDGRKMALDIRLVNEKIQPSQKTKVEACAEQIYRIYCNDPDITQLVFCDISTPKEGFNVYDELSRILEEKGVKPYEIAYIQEGGNNSKRRQAIVDALNNRIFKVLIGSTPMLGTGVNAQKHLFAVHHLDIPWRPADMTQREGRMIRRGNENSIVEIYRYVTEGSFDAYSWQLLESKQRFISQLLSGSLDKRDGDEVDSLVLQYADIKAIAIGNPKVKERFNISNEISRLKFLKAHNISRKHLVESNLLNYEKELERTKEYAKALEKDYKIYSQNKRSGFEFKELGEKIIAECRSDIKRERPTEIGEIFGFKIIVPISCTSEYPAFAIKANYEKLFKLYNEKGVELSSVEVAKQIDRYLAGITEIITELDKKKVILKRNIDQANQELNNEIDYDARIELLYEKLEEVEIELGVYDDE